MSATAREARLLEVTARDPNFWNAAEGLARCCDNPQRIKRPQMLNRTIAKLSRFPDCPLCGLEVNACDCDPNEYAASVYAAREREGM